MKYLVKAKFMQDDREAKAAAKKAAKMEKYAEKIEAAKREQEAEEKRKQEEAEKEKARAEAEAEQKKVKKAAVNAAKKQRKLFRQLSKGKLFSINLVHASDRASVYDFLLKELPQSLGDFFS